MLPEVKVFTIDATSSNSMKSSNPHSGVHETQISKCLDTMCLDPSCNQGGHMVCIALEGNGARPSHLGKGFSNDGMMYTLNTIEQHSVCYSVDCRNVRLNEELSITLQAKNTGGFSINCTPPILMENTDESIRNRESSKRQQDYSRLAGDIAVSEFENGNGR